jgi:hypothetical protein
MESSSPHGSVEGVHLRRRAVAELNPFLWTYGRDVSSAARAQHLTEAGIPSPIDQTDLERGTPSTTHYIVNSFAERRRKTERYTTICSLSNSWAQA